MPKFFGSTYLLISIPKCIELNSDSKPQLIFLGFWSGFRPKTYVFFGSNVRAEHTYLLRASKYRNGYLKKWAVPRRELCTKPRLRASSSRVKCSSEVSGSFHRISHAIALSCSGSRSGHGIRLIASSELSWPLALEGIPPWMAKILLST